MTANGDTAGGVADENNRNLDNMASDATPMDVDKHEENSSEPKEEDPRELYERKAQQFVKELYRFHENAG